MGIPESSLAIAALIVLALPGIVYSTIRRWLRGEMPQDRNFGLSLARGVVFSLSLTAFYLLVFGSWIFNGLGTGTAADTITIHDPRPVGLVVLVLFVGIPLVISLVLHANLLSWVRPAGPHLPQWLGRLRVPVPRYGYTSTPTAWDYAGDQNQNSYVRIRRASGLWVGGWFTKGSFLTTYPEPPSIYINEQYRISKKGEFVAPMPNSGVWLTINPDDVVEWLLPGTAPDLKQEAPHGTKSTKPTPTAASAKSRGAGHPAAGLHPAATHANGAKRPGQSG